MFKCKGWTTERCYCFASRGRAGSFKSCTLHAVYNLKCRRKRYREIGSIKRNVGVLARGDLHSLLLHVFFAFLESEKRTARQVQTNGDNTPVDALSAATEDLSQEMEGLREVFQEQVAAAKHAAEQEQFGS